MNVSPVLAAQATYPFVRIEQAKRDAAERNRDLRLRAGRPREPTDPLIRQALVDALGETRGYPKAEGLPELRERDSRLVRAAFGVGSTRTPRSCPRTGARRRSSARAGRRGPATGQGLVRHHGARLSGARARRRFAGAEVVQLPLRGGRTGSCPTSTRCRRRPGARRDPVAQLPEQPDGAVAPLDVPTSGLARAAREHDFLVASDEAYTELWFESRRPRPFRSATAPTSSSSTRSASAPR